MSGSHLPLDLVDIDSQTILAIVIIAVVLIAVALMIPKVRRMIRPRLTDAAEALQVLRTPSKVLELFLGNLASQVILAATLGLCVRAFGEQSSLGDMIVVYTLASLLSGVLPVPGGIGVMEAAISAGLVAAGIPQTAAVSAAIMFRIITFYLPPIWGGLAMRSLRKHEYV
ncbi:MAG: lysylphosphatidylglycerol synthase transmembrane domain-containing protein [Actinomycetota bacterium]